jgi:hexulose-6-phosphate isomerase
MLKFDFKAYSAAKAKAEQNEGRGFNVPIGEGDEDWPEVLKALAEVGYDGWATAEVAGGGESELRDIAGRMNRCLGLS